MHLQQWQHNKKNINCLGMGVEIEALRISGNGKGYPLPRQPGLLGECRKLPSGNRGSVPTVLLFGRDIRPLIAIFVSDFFPSPPPSSATLRSLSSVFAIPTTLYFKIRVRSALVSFSPVIFGFFYL